MLRLNLQIAIKHSVLPPRSPINRQINSPTDNRKKRVANR